MTTKHPYGFGVTPEFDKIPEELKAGKWCVWKARKKKNGKFDKIPYDGQKPISTAAPEQWLTFAKSKAVYERGGFNGVGRLSERDGYTIIDIDNTTEVPAEIKQLGETYGEISPSGKGLRLVYKADEVPDADLDSPFEVYSGNSRRFLTFTGFTRKPKPIAKLNGQLKDMVARHRNMPTRPLLDDDPFVGRTKPDFTDEELREYVFAVDPDAGHDTWFKVFQGIHNHYDGSVEGRDLIIEWSRQSKDFDENEIIMRYRTLGKDKGAKMVTAATIKSLAKEVGVTANVFTEEPAEPEQPSEPLFLTVSDNLLLKDHHVRWTIKKYLEKGIINELYGQPGSGKSFIALDMACCIATGRPWWDHKVKRGKVIIIAGEGYNGMIRRIQAWKQVFGEGYDFGDNLIVTRRAINFGVTKDLILLRDFLDGLEGPIEMINIDTLARATAGMSENDAQEMGPFMEKLNAIARKYDCSVFLNHHAAKNSDQSRGSSAIKGAIDSQMRTTKSNSSILLECTKMKDAEEFDPIGFKLVSVQLPSNFNDEDGDVTYSAVLERDDSIVENAEKGKKLSPSGEQVMKAFDMAMEDTKLPKAPCPVDVTRNMGLEAPAEGLYLMDVRDVFMRMNSAESGKKDGRRQTWKRGLDDCKSKEMIIELDEILVKI